MFSTRLESKSATMFDVVTVYLRVGYSGGPKGTEADEGIEAAKAAGYRNSKSLLKAPLSSGFIESRESPRQL